jgi:hypothetical protein
LAAKKELKIAATLNRRGTVKDGKKEKCLESEYEESQGLRKREIIRLQIE